MNHPLIYHSSYHLWRKGEYLGIAKWVDDPNIGEAFISKVMHEGEEINEVFLADRWELVEK